MNISFCLQFKTSKLRGLIRFYSVVSDFSATELLFPPPKTVAFSLLFQNKYVHNDLFICIPGKISYSSKPQTVTGVYIPETLRNIQCDTRAINKSSNWNVI